MGKIPHVLGVGWGGELLLFLLTSRASPAWRVPNPSKGRSNWQLLEKKTLFSPPPKKGHFFVFFLSVSLSFSLALFSPPPFSLSLSLCLSVFLFFLPSFLSFFFASEGLSRRPGLCECDRYPPRR